MGYNRERSVKNVEMRGMTSLQLFPEFPIGTGTISTFVNHLRAFFVLLITDGFSQYLLAVFACFL